MNDTTSLIKSYKGKNIRIREDKYVCLTDMATASGKRLNNWIQTDKTLTCLETLSSVTGKPVSILLELEHVAPCPRFVTKNLYSHDAWRLAYPGIALPETTTLVLAN